MDGAAKARSQYTATLRAVIFRCPGHLSWKLVVLMAVPANIICLRSEITSPVFGAV